MSSSIRKVGFDPNGAVNYKNINPLHPLQQNGEFDITRLVYEIVTKDFGYKGTEKYTLTLKNTEMVLSIWESSNGNAKRQFAKIEHINRQWMLQPADGKPSYPLSNPTAATNRLAETLDKISDAYERANPGCYPINNPASQIAATTSEHDMQAYAALQLKEKESREFKESNERILSANMRLNTQLQEKNEELDRVNKIHQLAQDQIERLQLESQQRNEALQAAQDETTQARKDAEHALKSANHAQQEAAERKREVEQVQQQASNASLAAARAAARQMATLTQQLRSIENEYRDLEAVSKELEAAQEQQMAQLQKTARSANAIPRLEARIGALTKQLHEAEEARIAAEEKALLYARLNAQLQESSHSSDATHSLSGSSSSQEEIDTPNSSSHPSINLNVLNQKLEQTIGSEVAPTWVGPILINLAYLGEMPENNRDLWIKKLFTGITDKHVAEKKRALLNYYPPSNQTYNEVAIVKIFGDLQTDMSKIKDEIKRINDSSLDAEKSMFLAKKLVKLQNHLKLVVDQFDLIKAKNPKEYTARKNRMDQRRTQADAFLKKLATEIETVKKTLNKIRTIK